MHSFLPVFHSLRLCRMKEECLKISYTLNQNTKTIHTGISVQGHQHHSLLAKLENWSSKFRTVALMIKKNHFIKRFNSLYLSSQNNGPVLHLYMSPRTKTKTCLGNIKNLFSHVNLWGTEKWQKLPGPQAVICWQIMCMVTTFVLLTLITWFI